MLENLNFSSLTHLESGQHVKNVHTNLTTSATITDTILQHYMTAVKTASDAFDESMVQLAKSDETAKIEAADVERDQALSTLVRAINVFEYSKKDDERPAFTSMQNLFGNYSGMQSWNYMQETNGIDNLIADLGKPNYNSHVILLNLSAHINRLQAANESFKSLFSGRSVEEAEKPVTNTKQLRRSMYQAYNDMTEYIYTMSKTPNANAQFTNALQIVNVERKYYADLVARRTGRTAKPDTI